MKSGDILLNVAIIDAELIGDKKHRFPNLASMKLSGYHKSLGDSVVLITDYRDLFSIYIELSKNELPNFDFVMLDNITKDNKKYVRYYKEQDIIFEKIFISKVFTGTLINENLLKLQNVEYGGTGFFYDKAKPLAYEIEHHMPDYHLYDKWIEEMISLGSRPKDFEYYTNYSIGFTTRGCFRKCQFCVNRNCSKVDFHSAIGEFLDPSRKYICLLDDNVLVYPGWKGIFTNLQATGKYFQYKQGMDERILDDEKAKMITKSKYKGDYIFAFDNISEKELIQSKLRLWRSHSSKTTKFYVFCGFDRNNKWDKDFWLQDIVDTFERVKILMRYGCLPYIMRFERYEDSPYRGMYINFARWCNQPSFFKKKSFREFCLMKNANGTSTITYMEEFEYLYPEVAKEYYDLKFESLNQYLTIKQ